MLHTIALAANDTFNKGYEDTRKVIQFANDVKELIQWADDEFQQSPWVERATEDSQKIIAAITYTVQFAIALHEALTTDHTEIIEEMDLERTEEKSEAQRKAIQLATFVKSFVKTFVKTSGEVAEKVTETLESLQQKAKALGIKGWNFYRNVDKLQVAIAKAQA